MSVRLALGWVIGLLLLASASCETGQILTPAEATARARQTAAPAVTPKVVGKAEFKPNDTVEFAGTAFLVPLRKEPGEGNPFSYAGRGDKATVLASQEVDDEIWYLVTGTAGQGWVPAEFLKAVGPSTAETSQEAGTTERTQIGDTVYLTGRGFLINLMDQPGGRRIVANQERGVAVTIVEIAQQDSETWYLIDAPTGQGWVTAENISTEAP